MSEAESSSASGEVHIYISEEGIRCESELSAPEVVLWLECARSLIVREVMGGDV